MDGDEADLRRLVTLKQQYDNVLLKCELQQKRT